MKKNFVFIRGRVVSLISEWPSYTNFLIYPCIFLLFRSRMDFIFFVLRVVIEYKFLAKLLPATTNEQTLANHLVYFYACADENGRKWVGFSFIRRVKFTSTLKFKVSFFSLIFCRFFEQTLTRNVLWVQGDFFLRRTLSEFLFPRAIFTFFLVVESTRFSSTSSVTPLKKSNCEKSIKGKY